MSEGTKVAKAMASLYLVQGQLVCFVNDNTYWPKHSGWHAAALHHGLQNLGNRRAKRCHGHGSVDKATSPGPLGTAAQGMHTSQEDQTLGGKALYRQSLARNLSTKEDLLGQAYPWCC